MTNVTLAKLQAGGIRKKYPSFRAGQTVKVYEKIVEGTKERLQVFEGLIIQCGGISAGKTITVRKVVGGIGVEKTFSIQSPVVSKIEVVKEAQVRRGKLFFMRDRMGKSARLKEKFLTEKELKDMTPHEATEEEINEAVEAKVKEEEEKAKEEETTGEVKS